MFRGSYKATVDVKGRLKIPAEFKSEIDEKLGPKFFVTSLRGDKASVYPLSEWESIEKRLHALPTTDPDRTKFLNAVSFWGRPVEMDTAGRIVLPPELREHAGLNGEALVMGFPERLEVWNYERIAKHVMEDPITAEDEQRFSGKLQI